MNKITLTLLVQICLFIPASQVSYAQYDSIENNLKNFQRIDRIKEMISIADGNIYSNIKLSLVFAKNAYDLSKASGYKSEQMRAGKLLGRIYTRLYDLNTALNYLNDAISLGNSVSMENDYTKILINAGEIYFKLNDYNASLEYFLKAQNESHDTDDIADVQNFIGKIYFATGDMGKSLEYFNKSLNSFDNENDKSIASESNRGIAMVKESLGSYSEAVLYYFKAMMIARNIKRQDLVSICLNDIGNVYIKLRDYKNAENFSLQAMDAAIQANERRSLSRSYENLMDIYSKLNKFDLAFKYSRLYTNIRDSVFNDDIAGKIASEEVKLDIERKDKELAVLSKENDLISFERNSIYAISFLAIAFAVYIFISYKKIHRINQKLKTVNTNLSDQNSKLEKSEKDLIKINNEKNKLFSIISHDLRGPYSGYLGLLSILIENIDNISKEEINELCLDLYGSIEGQYVMLENILDWAKIQMGKMEFVKEKFNVTERLNSLITSYIPLFKNKSIVYEINTSYENKYINMDVNTFDSVLRNLITNSIKFTNQNGKIRIDVGESINDMLLIKVTDSGVGMTQDKIDELLKSSKNISSFGTEGEKGSGIGMYLVKELIEKNKGEIKISSVKNSGTTVEVYLPKN